MKLRSLVLALICVVLVAGLPPHSAAGQETGGSAVAAERALDGGSGDSPRANGERAADLAIRREQMGLATAPAGAIEATYVYTNSESVAIPDASCPSFISSTITVAESFPIAQVEVGVWIEHTWRGDLAITLTSPGGTSVDLLTHPDGAADNLNVLLDDSSPNLADSVDHSPPPPYYPYWWKPDDLLSTFRFSDAQGNWTLSVCDDAAGDDGNLNAWSLLLWAGVILAPSFQEDAGCPGNTVPYDLEVVNATGLDQDFSVTYDSDWPVDGPGETGTIPDLMTDTIGISAVVPWYAVGMEIGDLRVTASGQGGAAADAQMRSMASLSGGYRDRADLPEGRRTRDHALVYDNEKLYKIGGHDGVVRAFVDIYDVESNTWSAGMELPGARTWIDGVAIDGKLYVAGGWSTYANSELYIYDTGSGTWSSGAAMPQARFAYAGVALGGKYYVIGGSTGSAYQQTLWSYDPATDTWEPGLSPMSVPRRYPLAGVIGGKIYVAGGMSSNITYVHTTEVYDPATDSWAPAAPVPVDGWVRAADGVISDRYLILVGGFGTDVTASASGLAYDAVQDQWGWLPKMSHLLYALEGDGDGSRFWLVSGRLYENDIWSYSPYTTALLPCPACEPAHDGGFSWEPVEPAANLPVTFAGVASGSLPIDYTWDYGDGGTGSGNPAVHTYSTPGTYTVTMTAANCGQQVVQRTVLVVAARRLFLPLIVSRAGAE